MRKTISSFLAVCLLGTIGHCVKALPDQEYVTIETEQGTLQGVVQVARNGDNYHAYRGIPYAQPPVDELRWKVPKPAPNWEGVRNATNNAELCIQHYVNNPMKVIGSEDCLYINVFVKPQKDQGDGTKHTLVWFHGGAFIFGGIDYYGADYVMENEDIILVTVQYRLNAFGFMSTEDEIAPGNYGSLDQVEALRWVQKNIESFGGNPNEVTIFGMSAGGASVHYLTMSPLTRGLYKNAISLSGSALCWWANIPNPRNQAVKLGQHFNCPTDNSTNMINCLKKVSAISLMEAQGHLFFEWRPDRTEREPMNMFSPRSDPERSVLPFMPLEPYVAMRDGYINPTPHMIGYTDKEGIWRANQMLPSDTENTVVWQDFVENYEKVAPLAYGFVDGQTEDVVAVNNRLTEFYQLKDLQTLDDSKVHAFIDVQTDSMFNYAIDETVKLRSKHKNMNTYFYMLTYPGQHTLANFANDGSVRRPALAPLKLASHGSDMLLIFNMFPEYGPMPEKDIDVSRKLIRLLIDFGKFNGGESLIENTKWRRLDLENPNYLLIDEEFSVQEGLPMQHRMQFWNSLPPVYWRYKQSKVTEKDEL